MARIVLQRKNGAYGFTATDEKGHQLQTDSSQDTGGNDGGFRPMQLVLAALGSCSAIDVISILTKQRQEILTFEIFVDGERETGAIPSLWKTVHMQFVITGDIEKDKVKRAVDLSVEKYCSVAETLRRGGTSITWELAFTHLSIS